MNSDKNAKLTARGREEMLRRMGFALAATMAAGFVVSLRTVREWMSRYRQGVASLAGRNSRPKRLRSKLTEHNFSSIQALRERRLTGEETAKRLGLCRSSVFRALRKLGRSRLFSLKEKEPIQRYQGEKPGQMLHLGIKRLGKID